MPSMDICNPPRPLDDIVIFLSSALERHLAEGRACFAIATLTVTDLAYFFVHTILTHNGFCLPINEAPRQRSHPYVSPFFPRAFCYTFCTAPRDSRAFVRLSRVIDGSLRVQGYWRYPGTFQYMARFNFDELERPLRLVFRHLLREPASGVGYERNHGEQELGVLRRFWREVEVNVCNPLRRRW